MKENTHAKNRQIQKRITTEKNRYIQFEICCFIIGNDWRVELFYSFFTEASYIYFYILWKIMGNKLLDTFKVIDYLLST